MDRWSHEMLTMADGFSRADGLFLSGRSMSRRKGDERIPTGQLASSASIPTMIGHGGTVALASASDSVPYGWGPNGPIADPYWSPFRRCPPITEQDEADCRADAVAARDQYLKKNPHVNPECVVAQVAGVSRDPNNDCLLDCLIDLINVCDKSTVPRS